MSDSIEFLLKIRNLILQSYVPHTLKYFPAKTTPMPPPPRPTACCWCCWWESGPKPPVSIIIITTKKSRRYCFWISTRLLNWSRSSRWRITRCQRKTLEMNINSTNPAPVAPRTALISTNHIPNTGEKDTAASRVALGPRRAALS